MLPVSLDKLAGRAWAVRPEIAAHVHGLITKEGFGALRDLAGLRREVHATDPKDGFKDHGEFLRAVIEAGKVGRVDERLVHLARPPRRVTLGADGAQAARRGAREQRTSTVAVIPIIGTLTQREEFLMSASTRSSADISLEARAASMDPGVDAILLEVDSPGGEVAGVPEAWAGIREAGKNKPVVASINSQAGSAAFYLASAADEIWVTPSGVVGSVGVYALHVDQSKAIEEQGEAWEFIVADDSPFKVEGSPDGALSDEARQDLKGHVNRYMDLFVRDLARGRAMGKTQVRENFGGGRMLGPSAAIEAGMVDQVGTIEAALQRAATIGREWREKRESAAARAAVETPAPTTGPPETPSASPGAAQPPEPPVSTPSDAGEEAESVAEGRDLARRLRDSA